MVEKKLERKLEKIKKKIEKMTPEELETKLVKEYKNLNINERKQFKEMIDFYKQSKLDYNIYS